MRAAPSGGAGAPWAIAETEPRRAGITEGCDRRSCNAFKAREAEHLVWKHDTRNDLGGQRVSMDLALCHRSGSKYPERAFAACRSGLTAPN